MTSQKLFTKTMLKSDAEKSIIPYAKPYSTILPNDNFAFRNIHKYIGISSGVCLDCKKVIKGCCGSYGHNDKATHRHINSKAHIKNKKKTNDNVMNVMLGLVRNNIDSNLMNNINKRILNNYKRTDKNNIRNAENQYKTYSKYDESRNGDGNYVNDIVLPRWNLYFNKTDKVYHRSCYNKPNYQLLHNIDLDEYVIHKNNPILIQQNNIHMLLYKIKKIAFNIIEANELNNEYVYDDYKMEYSYKYVFDFMKQLEDMLDDVPIQYRLKSLQ